MQYSNKIDTQTSSKNLKQAVITGDIVNSSDIDQREWMPIMHKIQRLHNAELYRGDSFQLRCANIQNCVFQALQVKATVKTCRNLDVRMSIGIGSEVYKSDSVAESGGLAYERSGKSLDNLSDHKDGLLKLTSGDTSFNQEMNIILALISVITTRWKPSQALAMQQLLLNGREGSASITQKELAKQLNLKANTISIQFSQANKRSIMQAEKLLHDKLLKKFS